jgi:oligosaccharyltransferase complex subunit beta
LKLFDGSVEQGYELTFRAPKEEKPVVVEHDVPAFAHIILFASESKSEWIQQRDGPSIYTSVDFAKDITPQSLVELLSGGTNLLIALSQKQTPLSSLASEFSLILPPPGMPLISFFPEREDPPSVIPIPAPASSLILSPKMSPVWFSGVPHALGNNPLLVPILNAPPESFAADSEGGADALVDATEKGGEGLWAGSQLSVATGFQAVGGARVTWVGGVDMFSDKFAEKEVSKCVSFLSQIS